MGDAHFAGVAVDTVNYAAHLSSGITQVGATVTHQVWLGKYTQQHGHPFIMEKWRTFLFLGKKSLTRTPNTLYFLTSWILCKICDAML